MFQWILDRPTTFYGFLSGMFMSVATTAVSNFALVAETPSNLAKLIKCGLLAFCAAAGWFLMSEYVGSLKKRVELNQRGFSGDDGDTYTRAVNAVAKTAALKLYILLLFSTACSVLWPFV